MANNYFQFKQFTIHQDRCAMKVGTDGTLLGAWSSAPSGYCRILDVGTGTGLIALMMAQRYPEASVHGIDIDEEAVGQAKENVRMSPFADRVSISFGDFITMADPNGFDVIVCNPPFFENSLTCRDSQRTNARHAVSLSYQQLMQSAFRLLKPTGRLSIIIPHESLARIEGEAFIQGFFISRLYKVRTTPYKAPKRHMIEFRKSPVKEIDTNDVSINTEPLSKSQWYQQITKDFYIK